MSIKIFDSETFEYHSESSHKGRHTVLRTLLPGHSWFHPGQHLWTVQGDTDYIWRADEDGLKWIEWRQLDHKRFADHWEELERMELLSIVTNHEQFFVGDIATIGLGSEIEVTPRRVYEHDHYDTWVVDLTLPTGFDTCRFQVYGSRRDWMTKRAILDKPMLIALRKSEFQEVVI